MVGHKETHKNQIQMQRSNSPGPESVSWFAKLHAWVAAASVLSRHAVAMVSGVWGTTFPFPAAPLPGFFGSSGWHEVMMTMAAATDSVLRYSSWLPFDSIYLVRHAMGVAYSACRTSVAYIAHHMHDNTL